MVQRKHKGGHDITARLFRWNLCRKHKQERAHKWYEHSPEGIVESGEVKVLCDVNIHFDQII